MKVLGIETSCDETAVAIVTEDKQILSTVLHSQVKEHMPYGGVVPELASRAHLLFIEGLVEKALDEAKTSLSDIDAVAVTAGPGLIGGVIVGTMVGKGIAAATNKPFIAVNHLEGHALTARLTNDVEFPFLLLLVSGGHCQILIVEGVGKYQLLGGTLDDALGEAFDKTAKLLGLGYPGGPIVEKMAVTGDANKYDFPRPLLDRPGCDFSFSGLKTAVFREVTSQHSALSTQHSEFKNDICASFQRVAGDILEDRIKNAIEIFKNAHPTGETMVVAGGVAANKYLNNRLNTLCNSLKMKFIAPPVKLCTDNAAMIAWAGLERFRLGLIDDLNFEPRARWPLINS